MTWFTGHVDEVFGLARTHLVLSMVPLLFGLLIALPLGWMARRVPRLYGPLIAGSGLLYTIPSLALFILMPLVLGTQILDPINVIVAMTIYTIALMVRTVADGLAAVPDHVTQAATSMGIGRWRRFFTVELPLAVPVIAAGLRVAAVSNVSIVSVAAIIGVAQLGSLFTDGFNRAFVDPIVVGVIACLVLAVAVDAAILLVVRLLTPWQRGGAAA